MSLPSGIILLWSGAIGNIPAGYVLCDGNNGTPDLRNRFIVGAGDTYAVNDTGGALTHTHDFTSDGHTHIMPVGVGMTGGAVHRNITNINTDSGTTDPGSSLPPYYALAYIMKT